MKPHNPRQVDMPLKTDNNLVVNVSYLHVTEAVQFRESTRCAW